MRCSTLPNEFWIAGAGSGKTQKVIEDAIEVIKAGGRVLVVTYTMNNQAELRSRFVELYGALLKKSNFC
ncbi:UvrD-helicase domain-containing protein [Escherichia coli]|nr:UvrD-helicase domain-containing protein [Escherichia coli]